MFIDPDGCLGWWVFLLVSGPTGVEYGNEMSDGEDFWGEGYILPVSLKPVEGGRDMEGLCYELSRAARSNDLSSLELIVSSALSSWLVDEKGSDELDTIHVVPGSISAGSISVESRRGSGFLLWRHTSDDFPPNDEMAV